MVLDRKYNTVEQARFGRQASSCLDPVHHLLVVLFNWSQLLCL